MNLKFDFNTVKVTEFGVGRDEEAQPFVLVPVDSNVQDVLCEMAQATWDTMQNLTKDPPLYEPSEKYTREEYVYLPLSDDLAERMRNLHQAVNLPMDTTALSESANFFCYYTRMINGNNHRLTAMRRATHFKGILKKRLLRFVTDALRIVEDRVFKLDNDFDLLIDDANIHILRPVGFEIMGKAQEATLAAVTQNVEKIQQDLNFVDFSNIQDYASKHPRAARLLASIRSMGEAQNIDKDALKKHCEDSGVEIQEIDGTIKVGNNHIIGFLEVLDRRRYRLDLVKGIPECFRAFSRKKIT